ncbi:nuclear transport factor 2 family protein [Christiangramia sabulilitoris]|uniref:Nuclear transport factor 2 family protein n=1 Tax=Christiangramia sabulilitoris TaxID=2583991 RepID=A0A550I8A1_9FLAO|nr:nuclear transport factor 2 family protein [Christiangramia sabulilitoris]TRO67205.1 nuclear transport factor 2 family protein [Christiangramia sabulilitoris]
MKKLFLLSILILSFGFTSLHAQVKKTEENINAVKRQVNNTIGKWHKAAAEANFDNYFDLMTDDAVFIGTDATENWTLPEFKEFSRPYFNSGKAWSFSTLDRNLYVHENLRVAWFDELLDTQMGICRGSGVVMKEKGKWKIHHYVLSIAIPNEKVDEITSIKKEFDTDLMQKLRNN